MKLSTIIAAAVLMCTSLTANAQNNKPALQHRYEHDAQGRVTARTAYAWNGDEWQPALRWTYTFNVAGYTVELARYDRRHHRFSEPTAKTVYIFAPDSSVAYVTSFARNDNTAHYELTDSFTAVYPYRTIAPDLLAANQ
jgi:hypothetical protein